MLTTATEFQRATGCPQPTYTDYQAGTRFACLLHLDGHAEPFGSLESLHSTKKDARREAARYAIEYFQAQGQWPEDVSSAGGIKKKKKEAPSTTTTQPVVPPEATTTPTPLPLTSTPSYAQQVAHLAATLSLSTPEWHYTPHPSDKDFHTVSCFFTRGGPHQGPIGTVRNVFGKKKAKEECARLTLEYLNEVHRQRISYGEKMLEGIGGAEEVVGVAVGMRGMDGEGEGGGRERMREGAFTID